MSCLLTDTDLIKLICSEKKYSFRFLTKFDLDLAQIWHKVLIILKKHLDFELGNLYNY